MKYKCENGQISADNMTVTESWGPCNGDKTLLTGRYNADGVCILPVISHVHTFSCYQVNAGSIVRMS